VKRDSILAASAFNVAARSWETAVSLAAVPILFRHLGAEAFGLIGFTQSMFAVLGLLDLGLGNAVTRELAKGEIDTEGRRLVRPVIRSLEIPLWGIALLLGIACAGGASFIAFKFLRVQSLSENDVALVLQLFAAVFILRWMSGFYRGVFFGLERQVRFNVFSMHYITVRFGGGVSLLAAGQLGLVGLFVWYLCIDALFFALLRFEIWRIERASSQQGPAFSLARLRGVLPYAFGTMGLALVGVLSMQFDKILIARLRPLPELGAYTLAFTLAMGIRIIPGAIWAAVFPRVVGSLHRKSEADTARILASAFSLTSACALSIAAPLALFSSAIVETFAGKSSDLALAGPVLTLLALGTFVESLNGPCYQQILAAGHARQLLRLTFGINVVYAVALIAALLCGGILGVALCWPLLQLACFALYARQARSLGGPDFAGALTAATPRFLVIIFATGSCWYLAASAEALYATSAAAAVASISLLMVGLLAWRRGDAVLTAHA